MPRDSATAIPLDELLKAYTLGYFPMARSRDAESVVWVMPEERGALPLDKFRCPRRLKRFIAKEPFTVRFDTAFAQVIRACAEPAPGRNDTWINDAIEEAYTELYHLGVAHSVECWRDGKLAGGLYGVALGGAFFGESMFTRETNASKVAFVHLAARLKLGGFTLLDAQFHTEHLAQFGVEEIPNDDYLKLLEAALAVKADFRAAPDYLPTGAVLQSITQTS
ncbi:MAG: leucyl/phenylalanyl-tRNA--protein transferase [Parvularculaceae bacterium]